MSILGLTLAQYAGLLAGGAAIVVVFYLLKLRRRRVAVPFGPLWEQVLMDRQATSLLQRLRRLLSLLLQLLLLFLLVTALADPRAEAELREGRDFVVLVDTSASMRARDNDRGDGRIGEARAWVREAIRKLGPNDRMMIVQMDAQVVPLTPMVDDRLILDEGLSKLRASDTSADFPRALRLATDVLATEREGHVILVSDGVVGEARDNFGAVDLGEAQMHWVKVGEGGRNVGISSFSVRRYPIDRSTCEIFLEVRNHGDQDERVELTLLGDGQEMMVRRMSVAKGKRVNLTLPAQDAASQTLEARLSLVGENCNDDEDCPARGRCSGDKRCVFPDVQPADDRAFALLPERRPIKVLAVSPGNLYLAAALLLDEYLDVDEMSADDYRSWLESVEQGREESDYETVVFDGVAPPPPPTGNLIYLGTEGEAPPLEPGDEVTGGIWFSAPHSKRRHPILRFVSFGDFEVYRAVKTSPAPGDQVIARSEELVPLLVTREEENRHVTILTFKLQNSDLPMRMAWPVLLMNTLSWYVEQDDGFISSRNTGSPAHIRVPGEVSTAEVCAVEGCRSVAVHEGEAVFVPERAGFHRVNVGGEQLLVAANLGNPRESSISPAETVTVNGAEATPPPTMRASVGGRIWLWLVMIAVAIVLLEWLTYHRRVTV